MRILHTADWHLGCKTDDFDRINEQKDALNQLVKISKEQNVDMVIIAGDIYDSFVPSSEAEDLFYKTVTELNNNGNTIVLAIAGNHDEPKRISNANIFANKFGIYMLGYLDKIDVGPLNMNRNIYPYESGKGYIKFAKQNGEMVTVAYLPYPSYYRFKEIRQENDNFSDKVKEWLKPGISAFSSDTINILTAHIMSYGINLSEEELEAYETVSSYSNFVSTDCIKTSAHYTALGHIHKSICVNKENNVYYSGSLINQFFNNDTPTSVIIVDVDKTNGVTNLEKISLNVKLLKNFTASSITHAKIICKDNPDNLLKITIENVDRVRLDEIKDLRNSYKNLITLSVVTKEAKKDASVISKKNLTNAEIFESFVQSKGLQNLKPDVKELYLELMSEDLYEDE